MCCNALPVWSYGVCDLCVMCCNALRSVAMWWVWSARDGVVHALLSEAMCVWKLAWMCWNGANLSEAMCVGIGAWCMLYALLSVAMWVCDRRGMCCTRYCLKLCVCDLRVMCCTRYCLKLCVCDLRVMCCTRYCLKLCVCDLCVMCCTRYCL